MSNRIGDSFSTPQLPPQGDSVIEISSQLREKILEVATSLQQMLDHPGKLGNDSFIAEFQTHALNLSALVAKATQC